MSDTNKQSQVVTNIKLPIILDPTAADEKAQAFLKQHEDSFVSKESHYSEKDTFLQFALLDICCGESFSFDFLDALFGQCFLTYQTIDALHNLAILTNCETALQFIGKEFTLDDVRNASFDYWKTSKFNEESKLAKQLQDQIDGLNKRYEEEINYLKDERKRTREFYEHILNLSNQANKQADTANKSITDLTVQLTKSENDNAVQKKEHDYEMLEFKFEQCTKDRDFALDELAKVKEELEKTKQELNSTKTELAVAKNELERNSERTDFYKDALNKIQKNTDSDVLNKTEDTPPQASASERPSSEAILNDSSFKLDAKRLYLLDDFIVKKKPSEEQLKIIKNAFDKGLSYKSLRKLCEMNSDESIYSLDTRAKYFLKYEHKLN